MKEHEVAGNNTANLRREFWRRFKYYMEESDPEFDCSRVTADGWMWHSTDISFGKLLSMVRVRLGEIGVKYTLDDMAADTVFSLIQSHQGEVNAVFAEPPVWRQGGENSHVVEIRRPGNLFAKQTWPEYFEWLRRQLDAFRTALGPLVGRVPPSREKKDWDQASFMRELKQYNPDSLGSVKAILEWTSAKALVSWASRRRLGSFTVTVPGRGFSYRPLSVRTDGVIVFQFAQIAQSPVYWDESRRLELLERINHIEHVALPAAAIEHRPGLPIAVLAGEAARGQLCEVLDWFAGSLFHSL